MKLLLLSIILITGITRHSYAQTTATDKPGKEIAVLLKPGKHEVNILGVTGTTMTPRQNELLIKAASGIQKNMKWLTDSMQYYINDLSAHHDKFGLTKEEFAEYLQIADKKGSTTTMGVTGHETLEVINEGEVLSFRGSGSLRKLDSLRIDMNMNVAVYKGLTIPYTKKVTEKAYLKFFNSTLSGYVFEYEDHGSMTAADITDLKSISMIRLSVMAGKLDNDEKPVLVLMAMQYDKGKMVMNDILPCVLD